MVRWYAVFTQPHKECLASEHLARQGFESYCPRYIKRRSHAGRINLVPYPLFPRYVFVAFDALSARWQAIRSTRGVIDLVKSGLEPLALPESVLPEIRAREDKGGFVLLGKHLRLARGDKFRIDGGPFADHIAIFEAKKDESRVIALLSLLGRGVTVQLPISAVAPAL